MLTSLFGDLGIVRGGRPREPDTEPDGSFAATAILESESAQVNDRGQIIDRHLHDLFVTGSPAQAMREHFASSRAELESVGKWIVLFDPARIWAGAVVKALSDAGGQPIERLHLREHGTLRTLALIERTSVVRRLDETLKVYHADVRASGRENAEISLALMERSHLTAVIVGPMQPHAIDAMLNTLHEAASQPTWRCPALLFMLPPGAVWIANKIAGIAWPDAIHVRILNESLSGASAVWNSVLGSWNEVKDYRPREAPEPVVTIEAPATWAGPAEPLDLDDIGGPITLVPAAPLDDRAVEERTATTIDIARASQALRELLPRTDGLLACAVVDTVSGFVLASEQRDALTIDLDLAAATCADALRAQRLAAHGIGLPEPIDELSIGAGARQLVLRVLAKHPQLFIVGLLDRTRTKLALTRLKLREAEQRIG